MFYNHLRDRITLADVGDGRFSYVNLATYETHGATGQFTYQSEEWLTLTTGGALTRLLNPTSSAGEDLPHFLTLGEWRNELEVRFSASGPSLRVDHRYVGRRDRYEISADGEVRRGFIGDYHLLHGTLRQQLWGGRISLTVGVKNLLNRDRVPVTGGASGGAHSGNAGGQLIDFGRNYFLGLRLRW